MARSFGSRRDGAAFDNVAIAAVWQKGRAIANYSAAEWRYDVCGKPIAFGQYGNTKSDTGWEIDHMKPVAQGGGDELGNLQPLQWQNNRRKGDTYPWTC